MTLMTPLVLAQTIYKKLGFDKDRTIQAQTPPEKETAREVLAEQANRELKVAREAYLDGFIKVLSDSISADAEISVDAMKAIRRLELKEAWALIDYILEKEWDINQNKSDEIKSQLLQKLFANETLDTTKEYPFEERLEILFNVYGDLKEYVHCGYKDPVKSFVEEKSNKISHMDNRPEDALPLIHLLLSPACQDLMYFFDGKAHKKEKINKIEQSEVNDDRKQQLKDQVREWESYSEGPISTIDQKQKADLIKLLYAIIIKKSNEDSNKSREVTEETEKPVMSTISNFVVQNKLEKTRFESQL